MFKSRVFELLSRQAIFMAGSYMAIQGVSPLIIGKALGHRSPQATAIYARLTQDPVRQALENAQAALADPERLRGSRAVQTGE